MTLTKLKTLVAATVLAIAVVPFSASPAQACWSVQCVVDCVESVTTGEIVCRF